MAADLLAGEPCKALGQCMRSTHGLESRSATLAVRPFESENFFDVVKLECCNAGTRTWGGVLPSTWRRPFSSHQWLFIYHSTTTVLPHTYKTKTDTSVRVDCCSSSRLFLSSGLPDLSYWPCSQHAWQHSGRHVLSFSICALLSCMHSNLPVV